MISYGLQTTQIRSNKVEPVYFKVPRLAEETLRAEMCFYDPVHYHEECQITFILESDGILFIGDRSTHFHRGELFFIGPIFIASSSK